MAIGCRVVGGAQGVRTVQVRAERVGRHRREKKKKKSELQPVESHKAFIFMTLFFLCRAGHFFFRNFFFFFGLLCVLLFPSGTSRQLGHAWHTLHATRYPISFDEFYFIRPPSFFFSKKKRKNGPISRRLNQRILLVDENLFKFYPPFIRT